MAARFDSRERTKDSFAFAVKVAAAAAGVALAAQLSIPIPGAAVPQSAQTLAVIVVGGLLGPVGGSAAIVLYICAGVIGLPVFADGGAGLQVVLGSSAGYLVGFVIAAWCMGWLVRRLAPSQVTVLSRFALLFAFSAALHCLILGLGALRLVWLIGGDQAVSSGVLPFVWGGVVKSVLGAAMILVSLRAAVAFGSR